MKAVLRACESLPSTGALTTTVTWFKAPDLLAATSAWTDTQSFASAATSIIVNVYHSVALGLTVTDTDLATAGPLVNPATPAAFVRNFSIQRTPNSPVQSVQLIYYEHFAVDGSRLAYVPLQDSCLDPVNDLQTASFDAAHSAIVQSWSGVDAASLRPSSVAFAFGFDRPASAYQVGLDHESGFSPALGPADGYDQLSSAPYVLGDSPAAVGPVTGTLLSAPLQLSGSSPSVVRVVIAAGSTSNAALAELNAERTLTFAAESSDVEAYWNAWLSSAPLPKVPAGFSCPDCASPQRIEDAAERALIVLRLAVDPDSGAIVAAPATEAPFGEDWIRDGAYIDEALDEAGYHPLVTRHELFEAASQSTLTHLSPLVPPGNWPENVYGDGLAGGLIPYEIDETGFGAWTLYEHSTFLSKPAGLAYLRQVFPAISNAANWLALCKDSIDGLECPAFEDDEDLPTQTISGAGPALLGLRSAVTAADALGLRAESDVAEWQQRARALQQAINDLYLPSQGIFGWQIASATLGLLPNSVASAPSNSETFSYGGYLVWPVALDPYSDPRMVSETDHVVADAMSSLEHGGNGGYENRGLLAACTTLPTLGVTPAWKGFLRSTIQRAIGMLAESSTQSSRGFSTDTGLLSETWAVHGVGSSAHVVPDNDAPQSWEEALFYLTARCAFP